MILIIPGFAEYIYNFENWKPGFISKYINDDLKKTSRTTVMWIDLYNNTPDCTGTRSNMYRKIFSH